MSNDWGKLLGMSFDTIRLSENEESIAFSNSRNSWIPPVIFDTDGDCCSETWFADLIGINTLVDAKGYGLEITGINLLDMPDVEDGRSRQDVDSIYGVRLTTSKGQCDIIYRNSSNGYYGGSAFLSNNSIDDPSYKWREIMEDVSL